MILNYERLLFHRRLAGLTAGPQFNGVVHPDLQECAGWVSPVSIKILPSRLSAKSILLIYNKILFKAAWSVHSLVGISLVICCEF